MTYSLPKRMVDLYSLLAVCFLPLPIAFGVRYATASQTWFLIAKVAFIGIYLSILLNPKIFGWMRLVAPSLKPYVIRFAVTAFLLFMIGFFDASPSDGVLYYVFLASIILGIVFIGVAKIGAIVGK